MPRLNCCGYDHFDMMSDCLVYLLQPDYFTAKATAVFYKKDNCLYKVRIRVINDYLPSR